MEQDAAAGRATRPDHLGPNLTWALQEALGRSIVGGDYRNQPFPTEAQIDYQHGVSRSVTREAVKMLSAKGLLDSRPRQGTFVRPEGAWNLFDTDVLRWMLERRRSLNLLRHFNELRISIEPQAAALAAATRTAEQQAAIAAGLKRMRVAQENFGGELEADIDFHLAILRASNNPFFGQFRSVVETALRFSIRCTRRLTEPRSGVGDHAAVADAIARGDVEEARAAMTSLIGEVLATLGSIEAKSEDFDRPIGLG